MNTLDQQLINACTKGKIRTALKLLHQGANPNTQDPFWKKTPFLIAAENGDIKMLQLLIRHGATPHTTDDRGRSALHYALENRHYDIAQYLLNQLHLDPNTKDHHGITPFMLASEKGDIPILHLLIQHGANPYTTDHLGQNALHYATAYRHCDTVQYLITQLHLDPNTKDNDGITPFLIAAQNGDLNTLQILIQLGANPYTTDLQGRDALYYAVKNRHHDIAQYLLTQLHFNPNTQYENGITPFILATENGDMPMLQILIQLGANPSITDRQGRNALYWSVKCSDYSITQYLITQLHLDPNTKDNDGITPFMLASEKGDIGMLKLLTQLGADPSTTDKEGQTAIYYAIKNFCRNITLYLITQLGLDPNTKDHQGITPFMLASEKGDIPTLQHLIQLGANPYTTDNEGQNALHYAKKPITTHFLISVLHLNPNTQDHQGNTPLLTTINHHKPYKAKTLTQLGTHPNIPNHQGQKPTTIAHHEQIPLGTPQPSTITL